MSCRTNTCFRCGVPTSGRYDTLMCFPCRRARVDESKAAIAVVAKAIRHGELPKAKNCTCVDCGKPAFDYDHRDYLEPLNVVPVCRGCNQRRGPALDSVMRAFPTPRVKVVQIGKRLQRRLSPVLGSMAAYLTTGA